MTNQNSKLKQCQNCKTEFKIEPEDFEFYAKIKVPPPTFCPDCRLQRRLAWRNERTLYKRKCDAPGHNEDIISIYHKDSPFKVYDQKYWWSDNWDPMDYGRDYDWNKPFFEQFEELTRVMPRVNLINVNQINSEYVHFTTGSRKCYLLFVAGGARPNEECLYGYRLNGCNNCVDSTFLFDSQYNYEAVYVNNSYKIFWSMFIENSFNLYFCYNCRNCHDCLGCTNIRNQSYRIFNKQYTEKEYREKFKEFCVGSYKNAIETITKFHIFTAAFPRKFSNINKSYQVIGDDINNSTHCILCFDVQNSEDSKFLLHSLGSKDCYDVYASKSEFSYEAIASLADSHQIKFSYLSIANESIQYSIECHDSSNLFGCVGLRHKQYCILNKQYTKEEYERLVPKIIKHMNEMPYIDKKGRVYKYGEFFPTELSPFSYNETVAQEYFPLTKEQATNKGYSWKEPEEKDYQIDIKSENLPDHIKDVKDDILGKVIQCAHAPIYGSSTPIDCNEQCTTAFKIIPQELEFYRKMNLPLPRLCPNCRHYQRIKQRNPLKLWHRKCQCAGSKSDNGIYKNTIEHPHHKKDHCSNEFETSYAPERPEIVYCEKCYLQEVA